MTGGEAPRPTGAAEKTTTLIGTTRATDASEECPGDELTLEELQRVRAVCAAMTETVDGARMLLEETYRNCATLSSMVGLAQRRMARQKPSGPVRRARSSSAPQPKAEGTPPRGALDPLALERARLEGALLVSRTAAHLVGNDLTTTIGLTELVRLRLRSGKSVDPKLLDDAVASAKRAAHHLQELLEIAHLELERGGSSTATLSILDLALSKGENVKREAGGGR